ncbi:hypothetical protein [Corynebacterium lowii]|uniref:Uncharacterized protein n=1 Tax=Corynebacterium lowii TaxID=1544413 RepID=A0A0N8VZU0_9CORY|nr:hypothetical protein [Corynebacterium lowii]KQB84834.1 hypothetical protein Clow_02096 [Corynebacterium lowii]MDP9851738.1 hypothetical protein [Corynebacterium lowii]
MSSPTTLPNSVRVRRRALRAKTRAMSIALIILFSVMMALLSPHLQHALPPPKPSPPWHTHWAWSQARPALHTSLSAVHEFTRGINQDVILAPGHN